jgi:hypothetical protein
MSGACNNNREQAFGRLSLLYAARLCERLAAWGPTSAVGLCGVGGWVGRGMCHGEVQAAARGSAPCAEVEDRVSGPPRAKQLAQTAIHEVQVGYWTSFKIAC